MMKEVSCKVLPVFFKDMEKNKIPLDILCKDIPYNLDYLRNGKNNIEWDVFCQICLNTRLIYNDADYLRLGKQGIEWRVLPVLSAMLGFFLNSKDMYRLMFSNKKGINSQLFRCITSTMKEVGQNKIELLSELAEGYPYCKEFFLISKGTFIAAPMLLKHKPAEVNMLENNRGAFFEIIFPYRTSAFTMLRQIVSIPTSRRNAVRELNDAYELLFDRFSQLEESNTKVQKQARLLESAYSISQLARCELDLGLMMRAVAESLLKVDGFEGVEINVNWTMKNEPVECKIILGDTSKRNSILKRMFEAHGHSVGMISIWLKTDSFAADANDLLDIIIPPVTMEIFSAISYQLLDEYRGRHVRTVDEMRTAIIMERQRISRELHDDLGAQLSTAKMFLSCIKNNPDRSNNTAMLENSLNLIDTTIGDLKRIMDDLQSSILQDKGYIAATEELVSKINQLQQINFSLTHYNTEKRLDRKIEHSLFRITQELINNSLKYARAKNVSINLVKHESKIVLMYEDDGKGFNINDVQKGNGLLNIEARCNEIGGRVEFDSSPGSGARTIIEMPLAYAS